ncbi:hypothetical protein A3D42_00975 [Candidatus Nomurabacteria bacterium RIFCSPHIGHO2_02_FULL_41_18]|uniref:DUF3105 domain-containing protein n=1 Tax=Candidatus Nomurabacteria bacterium RIFCSPHIGHO2_02_FULL_41_18 TaxID=1801754 RepID=A0A1F6W6T7_9BACT|nr:MAG: hypothetical protein A2737_03180 [Candidatus Nomurabacteria bacterium RIFCSPHIGHO2_01_FULL_41_71]OGI77554.1 MAG: hypothetical protein A3D42_00975 [Candidatus Nomurabacteria bacterium RIFCSPHIGHO2_02_FULL_41_18]OGI89054.1 MAG: hypothetical protein A3B01_00555 [Candidatus Nomurabacteria bacterium RIFCSPLOWO2_01_FULL_41_52b]OGJ00265.1 MAG: hypothetical protein A3I90_01590 [Candidatus Nomurabacteria bacterium RIFCSPLOWO2_02_FULL_41_9]
MKTEHKVFIGIGLLTLVIIVGGTLLSTKGGLKKQEELSKTMMGEKIADLGAAHVAKNAPHSGYNSNPPTSGPHWTGVAGAGIKDEPVPDELVLHSMEHGAAVVWYREDLAQSDVDIIRSAFQSASGKKIMLPRKDLDVPVALTSWGYLLELDTIDGEKIKKFIETNNDRAPEKAPI